MEISGLVLVMAMLVGSLILAAAVTLRVDARPRKTPRGRPALQVALVPTAETLVSPRLAPSEEMETKTVARPIAGNGAMVLRQDMIREKRASYAILAIPADASFGLVAPDGSVVQNLLSENGRNDAICGQAFLFGGQQLIVCTSLRNGDYSLRVTRAGISHDFRVSLRGCPPPLRHHAGFDIQSPTPVVPSIDVASEIPAH